MALSRRESERIRTEKLDLWRELHIDVRPKKATIAQHGASGYDGYTGLFKIRHDGRTWWLGVTDEREADLMDGPRPLPEWLDEVLFHMGVDEVEE